MAPGKSNRHWLLCPVCMNTQESLSCHLRRSCMKESEESDREEVVEKAKSDVLDLLKTGRAFSYKVLSHIFSSSNPFERMIVELKRHHLFVTGEPTPLPQGNPRLVAETEYVLSPRDCWAIFEKAEEGFLTIINQLDDSSTPPLAASQCIFVLYYLEAIVLLKHCQRPCVVQNMKVAEWLGRKQESEHTIIYVKDHTTAAHFVVGIALSTEEEYWFEKYYTRVRPHHLAAKGKRKRDEQNDEDGDEFFFVSSTGKKINNPTSDLDRLHEKYNLPHVNSQTVRRTFEREAKSLDEPKEALVADYLAQSVNTAAKHYRMKNRGAVVEGADLLAKMVEASSAGPSGEGNKLPGENEKVRFHEALNQLLKKHPVTLSGKPPQVKERRNVSQDWERKLYTRWGAIQFEMRVNHTIEQFSRRMPAKHRVDAWVRKQGWKGMTANIGSEVIANWAPSGSVDHIMESKQIQTMVKTQQWKGLYIQDFNERGRGIVTTRTFKAGEVVCDYHGPVVSRKKGEEIHKLTNEKETGYIFFFRNSKGQEMCIDAHSETCHCHPGMQTVGRLINHSKKKANIRPMYFAVDMDGEEKDIILFLANRTLLVDEEVLFDYGVNKNSFNREGASCEWLDD